MSMISEQVKQIRDVADGYREMKCDICTQKVLYEAADTIEALSAKVREQNLPTHGEWIPVSERLPEEDGWYLVTVRGYETVTDVSLYSADGSAWGDVSTKQKVIAWMPLPEPYKGGDDE